MDVKILMTWMGRGNLTTSFKRGKVVRRKLIIVFQPVSDAIDFVGIVREAIYVNYSSWG